MNDPVEKRACANFTGQRLRELRRRKKMTLQQVARGAGTHHSNLVRIEQGKNVGVSFYMLLRILRGMRSSLREFDCMKMKTGRRNESVYSFKNQPSWSRRK